MGIFSKDAKEASEGSEGSEGKEGRDGVFNIPNVGPFPLAKNLQACAEEEVKNCEEKMNVYTPCYFNKPGDIFSY